MTSSSGTKYRFDAQSRSCGISSFMSLADLHDPAKGYIVDDTLVVKVCLFDSFSILLEKSKNLLAELSSMNQAERSTSNAEVSVSNLVPNPQSLQRYWKELQDYLVLSLEEIEQANAFDEIERIARLIVQHSSNSLERTILEDLVLRLETFKELLSTAKLTIENTKTHRISLSGKIADVGARLDQGQEQLSTLETNFSNVAAEILQLTARKEELLIRKYSLADKLEKMNDQISKDLGERRDIRKETEEADKKWLQTREKLAQANLSWKLLQQNLEQCQKTK